MGLVHFINTANMTKYSAETEAEIAKAITYYLATLGVKKSKFTAKFIVPYCLFTERPKDRPAQNTKEGYNTAFTIAQEVSLRSYIGFLIFLGHRATKVRIRMGANSS